MPNGDKSTGVATDPPSAPPQQIDYSSFAHLTCDTIEAKRNQAKKIKPRLLEMDSQEELTAIKQELGDRFQWVWRNLLSLVEQVKGANYIPKYLRSLNCPLSRIFIRWLLFLFSWSDTRALVPRPTDVGVSGAAYLLIFL